MVAGGTPRRHVMAAAKSVVVQAAAATLRRRANHQPMLQRALSSEMTMLQRAVPRRAGSASAEPSPGVAAIAQAAAVLVATEAAQVGAGGEIPCRAPQRGSWMPTPRPEKDNGIVRSVAQGGSVRRRSLPGQRPRCAAEEVNELASKQCHGRCIGERRRGSSHHPSCPNGAGGHQSCQGR